MSDSGIRLLDTAGNRLPNPDLVNNEVILPEGHEWVWCLDARHEAYHEMEKYTILARAATNRKRYVLFSAEQLGETVEAGEESDD